jgi:hypothetical protein
MNRTQGIIIAAALLGLVFAGAIFRLAGKQKLSFRYAVGWISICSLAIFASAFIPMVEPISVFLSTTPAALLAACGIVVLTAICIQLTVSISGIQRQISMITDVLAQLQLTDTKLNEKSDLKRSVLVVVPAYNEESSIGSVVQQILANSYDVLVVNDCSTDQTSMRARQAGACVLDLPINLGVGGALRSGFRYAVSRDYAAVVQVDADGQHPIHQIAELVSELERSGSDMVIGSRFSRIGIPMTVGKSRRVVMKFLAHNASRATGSSLSDVTSGFRIITGQLLEEYAKSFPNNYLGDTYEAVMAAGLGGYQVVEMPADITAREFGESSASTFEAFSLTIKTILVVVLKLHFRVQKKFAQ